LINAEGKSGREKSPLEDESVLREVPVASYVAVTLASAAGVPEGH
jgi:hypothetical protein